MNTALIEKAKRKKQELLLRDQRCEQEVLYSMTIQPSIEKMNHN